MNEDRRRLLNQETGNNPRLRRAGLPGWSDFDKFLEELKAWGQEQGKVVGIFVYGSIARGEADRHSDVDLVVVVRSSNQVVEVEQDLLGSWECLFNFVKDSKHIAFLKRPFIKVELTVVPEDRLSELRTMLAESPVIDMQRAVVVDKSGTLGDTLSRWSSEAARGNGNPFQREADSFLYYYNGFYAPFIRGDAYRAFFQYCLMFFKIATLSYIAQGGKDYLYAPRLLMSNLDKHDTNRLLGFSPVFNSTKMREGVEKMFDLFLELVERSGMTGQFPPSTMRTFRAEILARHLESATFSPENIETSKTV